MPNYLHTLAFLAFLASTAAATTAVAAPSDEPSLEDKKQLLEFMVSGFADMKPSPGPLVDVPESEPVVKSVNTTAIKAGLARFASSLSFWTEDGKTELIVDGNPKHVPGATYVKAELSWDKAYTSPKQASPIKQAGKTGMVSFDKLAQTTLPAPGSKKILQLEGTLNVRYPARLATTEFGIPEIGKDKAIADATCKLVSIEHDLATLACVGKTDGIEIHPVSVKGVILGNREEMRGPTRVHRELGKRGQLTSEQREKLLAGIDDIGSEGRTFVLRASGKTATLLVIKPTDFQTETYKAQAHLMPDFGAKTCPAIAHPHFLPANPVSPFVQIGENKVKQGTTILASRSEAMFGFNNQMILFNLPELPNSIFATLKVQDLVLKKKGATVPFEAQGPFQDRDVGSMHSFRMEPTSGDAPVVFDLATGKVALRYPTQIVTRKVPAPGEPGVATIKGCEVIGYTDKALLESHKLRSSLRAFDKEGRPLEEANIGTFGGIDDDGQYLRHRFWGNVAWVELDEAKEWKDITLPFSLKPAPPRPKR